MKKALFLITLLSSTLLYAEEIDGIVARVNSHAILRSDVIQEMVRLNAHKSEYTMILNELIDRKLILKAAQDAKMTMQEWVVENRVREIVQKHFDGDRNKLIEQLSARKIAYTEWYQRIKEEMIVSAMRWSAVDSHANASPAAMKKMYEEHKERYAEDSTVTVSVILLEPSRNNLRDEVSKSLREKPFAEVAKAYSCDTHAEEGGQWKNIKPQNVFKSRIAEEIEVMPKGTISHWIDIDGWSFLLRKDEENIGRVRSFIEAYEDIEADVKAEESKRIYDAWVKRLRAEAYIKVY